MAQSDAELRFHATLEDDVSPRADKLERKLRKMGMSQSEVKMVVKAVDDATPRIKEVQKQVNALPQQTIINVQANTQQATQKIDALEQDVKRRRFHLQFTDNLSEMGNKLFSLKTKIPLPLAGAVPGMNMLYAGGGAGLAVGAAAAAGSAVQQGVAINSSMEQSMVTLTQTLKDSTKAHEETGKLVKIAQTTPFSYSDVLQADVRLRSYGIPSMPNEARKGDRGELNRAGDMAAAMNTPITQAVEAIADARQGYFVRMMSYGVRIMREDFDKGGKYAGKTYEQGLAQAVQRFQGAQEMQSKTFQGIMSNLKDVFQQSILKPIGAPAFGLLKDKAQQLQDKVIGDKPEAIAFQKQLGIELEKLQRGMVNLYSLVGRGKVLFQSNFEEPLQTIGKIAGDIADTFGKAFGGSMVFVLQGIGEGLGSILKPISSIVAHNPMMLQFYGTMKALSALGFGNIANPFTNLFSYIMPFQQRTTGLLRTLIAIPGALAKLGLVLLIKNFLDAKQATDALHHSFSKLSDSSFDRLNLQVEKLAINTGRSSTNVRRMMTDIASQVPTVGAEGKSTTRMATVKETIDGKADSHGMITVANPKNALAESARANAIYRGTSYLTQMSDQHHWSEDTDKGAAGLFTQLLRNHPEDVGPQKAGQKGYGVLPYAREVEAAVESMKALGGSVKDLTRVMVTYKSEMMKAGLKGPVGGVATYAIERGIENGGDLTRGQLDRGLRNSGDVTREIMQGYSHPSIDMLRKVGGPGMTHLGDVWNFKQTHISDEQSKNLLSNLDAAQTSQQTSARRDRQLDKLAPSSKGTAINYDEPYLKMALGVDKQLMNQIRHTDDAKERATLLAGAWSKVDEAAGMINGTIDRLTNKTNTLNTAIQGMQTRLDGIAHRAQQFQIDKILPKQREIEDISLAIQTVQVNTLAPLERQMRGLSQETERWNHKMSEAQYNMGKFNGGLLNGEGAALKQMHAMEQYNRQLQMMQLQYQSIGDELGMSTFREGYSSRVEPLMGLSLAVQQQRAERRRQLKDLEYQDKFGEGRYQMQQAARSKNERTEMSLNTRLSGIRKNVSVMDEATPILHNLSNQQYALQQTMAGVNNTLADQQQAVSGLQLQIQKLNQSPAMRQFQDDQNTIQNKLWGTQRAFNKASIETDKWRAALQEWKSDSGVIQDLLFPMFKFAENAKDPGKFLDSIVTLGATLGPANGGFDKKQLAAVRTEVETFKQQIKPGTGVLKDDSLANMTQATFFNTLQGTLRNVATGRTLGAVLRRIPIIGHPLSVVSPVVQAVLTGLAGLGALRLARNQALGGIANRFISGNPTLEDVRLRAIRFSLGAAEPNRVRLFQRQVDAQKAFDLDPSRENRNALRRTTRSFQRAQELVTNLEKAELHPERFLRGGGASLADQLKGAINPLRQIRGIIGRAITPGPLGAFTSTYFQGTHMKDWFRDLGEARGRFISFIKTVRGGTGSIGERFRLAIRESFPTMGPELGRMIDKIKQGLKGFMKGEGGFLDLNEFKGKPFKPGADPVGDRPSDRTRPLTEAEQKASRGVTRGARGGVVDDVIEKAPAAAGAGRSALMRILGGGLRGAMGPLSLAMMGAMAENTALDPHQRLIQGVQDTLMKKGGDTAAYGGLSKLLKISDKDAKALGVPYGADSVHSEARKAMDAMALQMAGNRPLTNDIFSGQGRARYPVGPGADVQGQESDALNQNLSRQQEISDTLRRGGLSPQEYARYTSTLKDLQKAFQQDLVTVQGQGNQTQELQSTTLFKRLETAQATHGKNRLRTEQEVQTQLYKATAGGFQNIYGLTDKELSRLHKRVNATARSLGITMGDAAGAAGASAAADDGHGGLRPTAEGGITNQWPSKYLIKGRGDSKGYMARVGEEGDELIIPLAPHRRERAKSLMLQAQGLLGGHPPRGNYANGGIITERHPGHDTAYDTAKAVVGQAMKGFANGGLLKGYDATGGTLGSIPKDADWVASYVDNYGGYDKAKHMFKNIPVVSIAVNPGHKNRADIYDVEPHGKTVSDAVAALKAGLTKGVYGGATDLASIRKQVGRDFPQWIAAWPGTGAYSGAKVGPYGAHQYASGSKFDSNVATSAFIQAVTGSSIAGGKNKSGQNANPFMDDPSFQLLTKHLPTFASGGFTGPHGALAGLTPLANLALNKFGLQVTAGKDDHNYLTAGGNVSDHSWGGTIDLSNSPAGSSGDVKSSETPQEWAFTNFAKKKMQSVVKQLIFDNIIQAGGGLGGTVSGHMNHVHIAVQKAFAEDPQLMAHVLSRISKGQSISSLLAQYGGDSGTGGGGGMAHMGKIRPRVKEALGHSGIAGLVALKAMQRLRHRYNKMADGGGSGGLGNLAGQMFHGGGSPAQNVALGRRMAAAAGWRGSQWNALNALWTGESGWKIVPNAQGSGAFGIPQALPGSKMASAGADWATNPATQIKWGIDYIKGRYGTPAEAYKTWLSRSPHWYHAGTRNIHGDQTANLANGEMVLPQATAAAVRRGQQREQRGDIEMVTQLGPEALIRKFNARIEDLQAEIKKGNHSLKNIDDKTGKKEAKNSLAEANAALRAAWKNQYAAVHKADAHIRSAIRAHGDASDGENTNALVKGEQAKFKAAMMHVRADPQDRHRVHHIANLGHTAAKLLHSAHTKHQRTLAHTAMTTISAAGKAAHKAHAASLAVNRANRAVRPILAAAHRGVNANLLRSITGRTLTGAQRKLYTTAAQGGKGATEAMKKLRTALSTATKHQVTELKHARVVAVKAASQAQHATKLAAASQGKKIDGMGKLVATHVKASTAAVHHQTGQLVKADDHHVKAHAAEVRDDKKHKETVVGMLRAIASKEMNVNVHNEAHGAKLTSTVIKAKIRSK